MYIERLRILVIVCIIIVVIIVVIIGIFVHRRRLFIRGMRRLAGEPYEL